MPESYPHLPNIRRMAGGGVTLFRIRGIRIAVDYSWFVVLFLIIFWLTGFYRDVLNSPSGDSAPYVLAVASAVLFFASILLHELGHAFVARRHDIGVSAITLWMFGGFARLEKDSDTPGTEFKIAIAGPLVTAVIVVVCAIAGLLLAGGQEFKHAVLTQGDTNTSGIAALVSWLGSINLLVLIFNLVPAFPLDGGRITRAIAWWRTGSRNTGTRFAATLGEWFGLFLILAGLGYFLVYLGDPLSGIWLAFVGFILRGAAKAALAQTEVSSRIEGISVADVMERDPVAIPGGRLDRAGPRRVLPPLPLPLVPGRGRRAAVHRPGRPRRSRQRTRRSNGPPRWSATYSPATAARSRSGRTTRSSPCSETNP